MNNEAEILEFLGKNPKSLMRDIKANAPILTHINLSNMIRNLVRAGQVKVEVLDNGAGRTWPYYSKV